MLHPITYGIKDSHTLKYMEYHRFCSRLLRSCPVIFNPSNSYKNLVTAIIVWNEGIECLHPSFIEVSYTTAKNMMAVK